MAAVRDARKLAADLFEIPVRIVGRRVACTGRQRPQTDPQLVPPCPDGLERSTWPEPDFTPETVHLNGGGQSVAVLVDALGDADAAG